MDSFSYFKILNYEFQAKMYGVSKRRWFSMLFSAYGSRCFFKFQVSEVVLTSDVLNGGLWCEGSYIFNWFCWSFALFSSDTKSFCCLRSFSLWWVNRYILVRMSSQFCFSMEDTARVQRHWNVKTIDWFPPKDFFVCI